MSEDHHEQTPQRHTHFDTGRYRRGDWAFALGLVGCGIGAVGLGYQFLTGSPIVVIAGLVLMLVALVGLFTALSTTA